MKTATCALATALGAAALASTASAQQAISIVTAPQKTASFIPSDETLIPSDQSSGPQQQTDESDEIVYVFGRAIQLTGEAQSASEGIVGFADFETRPLLRPGELVEVIPGMIATQHSQGGKANQYFLRGFNLDHGTDFAGSFDGVPLNLRSHAHMSGYLDINFLIPEIVQSVEFRKGVHYAQNGDYSAAGSASFRTYDTLSENFVQADITTDGEHRALIAGSTELSGGGAILGALQYDGGDGPFDRPEDLQKYVAFLKYSRPIGNATLRTSLMAYDNTWFATDQIPQRAVQQNLIGRFGTLDPDLGGDTHRTLATASMEWDNAQLTAYAQDYALNLYGNPTFFVDQTEGDQFVQIDERTSIGANGDWRHETQVGAIDTTFRVGGGFHTDFIDRVALVKTMNRVPTGAIRNDEATITLANVWTDATLHLTDRWRTTFGGRVDQVFFDVTSLQPENSGDGDGSLFSPKFSTAYSLTPELELYAAYGKGFHTNDPRGAVTVVDPATGAPTDPVNLFAESEGGEIGARYEPNPRFNISGSIFALELDSELIFVGDAGTSEPSDATERSGVELSTFWQAADWLVLDAQAAWSKARFQNAGSADYVPNSVEFVGGAGATFLWGDGWESSLRVRHLGEAALIEDNSVRAPTTTLVNLGVSRNFGRFELGLDVLNLLDAKDNDITYFYESQLQGEANPVEDIHFHPVHPRSVKLVLKARF